MSTLPASLKDSDSDASFNNSEEEEEEESSSNDNDSEDEEDSSKMDNTADIDKSHLMQFVSLIQISILF
jgi:hypothetical protein